MDMKLALMLGLGKSLDLYKQFWKRYAVQLSKKSVETNHLRQYYFVRTSKTETEYIFTANGRIMNNSDIIKIIWGIAALSFPVCILILAIIFKNEIKYFLKREERDNSFKEEPHSKLKSKTKRIDSGFINKENGINKQHKKYSSIEIDYPYSCEVEVCKNKTTEKYFIIIDEYYDSKSTMILPDGSKKRLELKLFNFIETRTIEELLKNKLITDEQLSSYKDFIAIGEGESNYVNSDNQEFADIKTNRKPDDRSTCGEKLKFNESDRDKVIAVVEQHFGVKLSNVGTRKKYLQDQSGRSFWVLGGYDNWHGIPPDMMEEEVKRNTNGVLVVAKRHLHSIEIFAGGLKPMVQSKGDLYRTKNGDFHFNVHIVLTHLNIKEIEGFSLVRIN